MRIKREINKILKCVLGIFTVCFLASSSAFSQSVLSEIEIKNSPDEYNITLQVNDEADVKKKVLADNKILLTVFDTSQAQNVPVLFEGDKGVDNIVINNKQTNVEILLQGEGVSQSNIFLKEINSGLLKPVYLGNDKKTFFKNSFYLLDSKVTSVIILGLIFMFTMFAFVKPKNGRELNRISSYAKQKSEEKSLNKVATIRNKISQSRAKTMPCIHYGNYSTRPYDFITDNSQQNEQIKKYG